MNSPSGVFSDWIGSGQQKLSKPAILSTSIPTQTAFLTASSTLASTIAPASMSEYLGTMPLEITTPLVEPCIGAISAASAGPSLSGPTNGLTAVWAMTSWSYCLTHDSLLAIFGLARRSSRIWLWSALFGGLNATGVGFAHTLESWSCGTPS